MKKTNFIERNKLGIGSGLIFGLIVTPLYGLAVISSLVEAASEWLLPVLSPFYFWSSLKGLDINVFLQFLLNGILFMIIGSLLQQYLRKINKNEKIVVYLFVALASIPVLLFLIDLLLGQ